MRLGFLFAAAGAATQFIPGLKDGDLELPGMSRARRAEQFVRRRYAGATLQPFLQLAFRVFDHVNAVWVGQFIGKDAVDKVICSVKPAVEI